jgi:hypothetical protein
MATRYKKVIVDSAGEEFDLDSSAHTYTYNEDGTLATDLAFDGVHQYLQTYTYENSQLTYKSQWVRVS